MAEPGDRVKGRINRESLSSHKVSHVQPSLNAIHPYLTPSRCWPLIEKILVHRFIVINQFNSTFTWGPGLSRLTLAGIVNYIPIIWNRSFISRTSTLLNTDCNTGSSLCCKDNGFQWGIHECTFSTCERLTSLCVKALTLKRGGNVIFESVHQRSVKVTAY